MACLVGSSQSFNLDHCKELHWWLFHSDIDKFILAIDETSVSYSLDLCGFLSVLTRWQLAGENYGKESIQMPHGFNVLAS